MTYEQLKAVIGAAWAAALVAMAFCDLGGTPEHLAHASWMAQHLLIMR